MVGDTEVATPTGWKKIKEVTLKDLVLQYNPTNHEVSWVNPLKLIKTKTKEIHHYRSNRFSQSVTPDHRMANLSLATGQVEFIESKDFKVGKGSLTMSLLSGKLVTGSNTALTPVERLLIAIQADGTASKRYTGEIVGTVPVWFTFAKQRKIDRLISLAEEAGIDWVYLRAEENKVFKNRNIRHTYKLNFPIEYLENINPKRFDTWVNLEDKNEQWARDFLSELVQWDGYIPETYRGETDNKFKELYTYYSSTVPENADIVQLIAACANYGVTRGIQVDTRKDSYKDVHRLWMFKDRTVFSNNRVTKEIEYLDTEQDMYCLTVPTSSFVIRHNDKVSVTGNCHTTFSLHMLNILRSGQEGKDYQDYYQELIPTFKQIVLETYEQEKAWAKHLFKDGAIIGVNEATSIQYLEYLIDFNITQAGLEPMFGKPNNPYPWIKHWFNSDAVQVTPQETEMTSYVLSPDGNISDEDIEAMDDIEL